MRIPDFFKKCTYGTVTSIGSVKTVGFKSEDNYYIDKHTYLFGRIINKKRFWNLKDLKKDKQPTKVGFIQEK